MNVYQKLQSARVKLQKEKLKKSGQNKFAGYDYFELSDFLPRINEMLLENNLAGVISFTNDLATLKIINTEKPEEYIEFTSPMATASLKGCHDVQNLGAVQTYLRRYLYVAAFEIVEHDALDSVTGAEDSKSKPANQKTSQKPGNKTTSIAKCNCKKCGKEITKKVYDFNNLGLCMDCQKEAKNQSTGTEGTTFTDDDIPF